MEKCRPRPNYSADNVNDAYSVIDWFQVRPRIEVAFAHLSEVDVHLFEPSDAEGVRQLAPEGTKPKMTPGRAAILKVLSIYREMTYPLSQLEVQKLVYFLTRAGKNLGGLQFTKHT